MPPMVAERSTSLFYQLQLELPDELVLFKNVSYVLLDSIFAS